MNLYDAQGVHRATAWERPVMPSNWAPHSIGGLCRGCGELTVRERCAIHPAVVVPHDRDGGYFAPWTVRCLPCFEAWMRETWRLARSLQRNLT